MMGEPCTAQTPHARKYKTGKVHESGSRKNCLPEKKSPFSSLDDKPYIEQLRDAYALAEFAFANMDREVMREAREQLERLLLSSRIEK